ncbi:MAG: peptide chain release factor N(5)-glutamine methyltransferase [Ruminococcus sp.]|nr:peptide chain release factor N(5)-glutamine methyltransferase [Ruminococcus sp.]
MVSIGELYTNVKAILENAGIDTYRFDAQCIMEQAFGTRLPSILTNSTAAAPENVMNQVREMVEKRAQGYPLQYILGEWEFYGYTFRVGEGVLIPRPDTETLVEQVLDICRENQLKAPRIADLCSGSGCIAVTLKKELPDAEIYAVELSEKALPYLRENARLNEVHINIIGGDVLSGQTAAGLCGLDIIVSNPPYLTGKDMTMLQTEVSHEPQMALMGGGDGLDFYRTITPLWRNSLRDGGFIAYEFGLNQDEAVSSILKENGFDNIQLRQDTAGIIRTAAGRKITEEMHNG